MPLLFHVDAFTAHPFAGNPAAVCLLDEEGSPRCDERWMQHLACEMNLSETAFVAAAGSDLSLRWFTPLVEVDLCGHATLAAAHVLWETGRLDRRQEARFATRSGLLTAGWRDGWIELDFPATACEEATLAPAYLAALGISEPRSISKGGPRHIIELASVEAVRAVAPDFGALRALPGRGIAVTAQGDGRPHDIVSRYFAPWVGVNEDPVTGSVHCALAPFWAPRLGRAELLAFQASARGGELHLRLRGNRVVIAGRAVTISRGEVVS